jgi:hypothetical protein
MNILKWLRKDVVVHCYTSTAAVFNYAPIKNSNAFIPEWWKVLPKSFMGAGKDIPAPTMKGCVGFVDLYKQGFMMPMWSDLKIDIGQIGTTAFKYQFSDRQSTAGYHSALQRGDAFIETEYQHLKIEPPWLLACEEDVNFLQVGAYWNNSLPDVASVMPGIVEFKYQCGANINTMWARQPEDKEYLIDFGEPLVQFIPITERNVKIQLHLISESEFQSRRSIAFSTTFLSKYRNNKRLRQQSGCPFHVKVEK